MLTSRIFLEARGWWWPRSVGIRGTLTPWNHHSWTVANHRSARQYPPWDLQSGKVPWWKQRVRRSSKAVVFLHGVNVLLLTLFSINITPISSVSRTLNRSQYEGIIFTYMWLCSEGRVGGPCGTTIAGLNFLEMVLWNQTSITFSTWALYPLFRSKIKFPHIPSTRKLYTDAMALARCNTWPMRIRRSPETRRSERALSQNLTAGNLGGQRIRMVVCIPIVFVVREDNGHWFACWVIYWPGDGERHLWYVFGEELCEGWQHVFSNLQKSLSLTSSPKFDGVI